VCLSWIWFVAGAVVQNLMFAYLAAGKQ